MSHAVNRATAPAADGGHADEAEAHNAAAAAPESGVDDGCIDTAPGKPCKPMRADAVRNRELLMITAAQAFEERGAEAPLEDIAKRAGVGIGTLYRHFPTRDALLEAVYRREVETLCDGVDALRAEHEPVEALSQWMRAFVVYVARKRGMAMALKAALGPENTLFAESHARIRSSLTALVGDAVAARQIRDDVDPMDLMRAMSGICMAVDPAAGGAAAIAANASTTRIVDLLLDGLRFGAAESTAAPTPDTDNSGASAMSDPRRIEPGPDHPITVTPTGQRVEVSVNGQVIARSSSAQTLQEAAYPPVQYVPVADVDPAVLATSGHTTYCPYKGEASYYRLSVSGVDLGDAVWFYRQPYDAVAAVADHVAFYPDRVEVTVG